MTTMLRKAGVAAAAGLVASVTILPVGDALAQDLASCLGDPLLCVSDPDEGIAEVTKTAENATTNVKDIVKNTTVDDPAGTIADPPPVIANGSGILDDGGDDETKPTGGKGKTNKRSTTTSQTEREHVLVAPDRMYGTFTIKEQDLAFLRQDKLRTESIGARQSAFLEPDDPGTLEGITQALEEAAKKFGFPGMLIMLVAGFLVIQGRFDRTDPKLATAPVSSEQDYLIFS